MPLAGVKEGTKDIVNWSNGTTCSYIKEDEEKRDVFLVRDYKKALSM